MPTLFSARSRRDNRGGETDAADSGACGNNRACYGILAFAVALVLFCALAASVSLWMAFTFGGLALVAFGAAGCLARGPNSSSDGGVSAADAAAAAPCTQQRRFGLPKAAINALPTSAYEPGLTRGGADVDLESGPGMEAAGREPCSVCLEDFHAGETVRQLPACKHLFHVECIDMWLDSHRTCPVCRCNLLPPPRNVDAKAAAPAPTADAPQPPPADEALPPV